MTGDDALVERAREVDALPRGRQGKLDIARGDGREAAVEQTPCQPLHVGEEPGRLDRAVEDLAGLRRAPLKPEGGAEHRENEREQVPLSRGAADRHGAPGVPAGGLELVEVHLGRREVGQRVEPLRDLRVGHRVDDGGGLVAVRPGRGDRAAQGGGHRPQGCGRPGQRPITAALARRALGPAVHVCIGTPIQAVDRELDHQRDGLLRLELAQIRECGLEPGVRLRVTAEQVLDAGAGGRDPDAERDGVRGHDLDALEQRGVAFREQPAARQRLGASDQQLHALGRRPIPEQPQRGLEPVCRACRRAVCGRLASGAEDRDCRLIARLAGSLDVVGSLGRTRATARQQRRGPLVCSEAPGGGGGLIDGSPHERVTEAKATRHVRLSNEVEPQEFIHRNER